MWGGERHVGTATNQEAEHHTYTETVKEDGDRGTQKGKAGVS